MNEQMFSIEGMTCNHCVMNVKNAIESVENVEKVEVSLSQKKAKVTGNFDPALVKEAIEKAGYKVV